MIDLLICNGQLPGKEFCEKIAASAHRIVCADGGANKAREYGFHPDLIVGDLDSITEETLSFYRSRGVAVTHLERQDDTDFEKALKILVEEGSKTVVVLGLTGGLLDHTLGNLSILQRYTTQLQFVLFDPDYRIDVITTTTVFTVNPGARVSIVPFDSATGVYYDGLQYSLPNATVTNGINEGTCNTALTDTFTVTLESGTLMVFRLLTEDVIGV